MAERPERICPHLHLPLQSGSDAVLGRMNRRWPVGRFQQRCREIGAALDRPALTTDMIVGFPGETEADFAATCDRVREIGFAKVHVFRFSPRPGTPAAEMSGQVPGHIAARRRGSWACWQKPRRSVICAGCSAGLCECSSNRRPATGRAPSAAGRTATPRSSCPAAAILSASSSRPSPRMWWTGASGGGGWAEQVSRISCQAAPPVARPDEGPAATSPSFLP